jgi:tetratricopeptide (TPR) repeat protein
MEMYNKAITLFPPYTYAFYNIGNIYFMSGQEAKGHYNLGLYHFTEGHIEEAIANFTQAIAINPNFADAYYSRGLVQYAVGYYKKSLADFQTACNLGSELGCKNAAAIKN